MNAQGHIHVRDYRDSDEPSWLRCRALSFLGSQYFDDVKSRRTVFDGRALCLVSADGPVGSSRIVGILDVEISGSTATIDTLASHPDYARRGVASALFTAALPRLADLGVSSIDAWTREDVAANAWYRRHGFSEVFRYLHVYKSWDDDSAGFTSPPGLSAPVHALAHAPIELEPEVRRRFRRVYVCRRYLRAI